MSLIELESEFRAHKINFKKEEDGLVLPAPGKGACYPILFTEGEESWIQGMVWFPHCEVTPTKLQQLQAELKERLEESETQVGFHDEKQAFWAGTFLRVDTFWEKMSYFVDDCDALYPLFLKIGETGKWTEGLLSFAFLPDEKFIVC